jgi:hypothetical protein
VLVFQQSLFFTVQSCGLSLEGVLEGGGIFESVLHLKPILGQGPVDRIP